MDVEEYEWEEGARGEVYLDMGPEPPAPSHNPPYQTLELTEGIWAAALMGLKAFLEAYPGFPFVFNVFYLPATGDNFHAASGILATEGPGVGRVDVT